MDKPASTGMKFWAIVIDRGETTQETCGYVVVASNDYSGPHTRTTEKKPALTVLITSSNEVAPLIMAIEARYTERIEGGKTFMQDTGLPAAWIGETIRLLAIIWATLAPVPVLPANAF